MLKISEYGVKQIFASHGIAVPQGEYLKEGQEASIFKKAGEDLVFKAQVPFGSRQKKGLVLLENACVNPEASRKKLLFRMKEFGPYGAVLVERGLKTQAEMYLAIYSDPVTRGPVLLFSEKGGIDIEDAHGEGLFKLPIDILTGLRAEDLMEFFRSSAEALTQAALRLYAIYRKWNGHFIEINPLALTDKGLVALDGKMELDEDAMSHLTDEQSKLLEGAWFHQTTAFDSAAAKIDAKDYRGSAHFIQIHQEPAPSALKRPIKASIGFNGVGTGVSLTAMDELVELGFFPKNFCDTSGNPPASKIYRITKIILSQAEIRGYFFITCVSSQQLDNTARGMIKAFKEVFSKTGGVPTIPALVLFRGAWDETAQQLFRDHGLANSPHLVILGRESSERDAAMRFSEVYDAYWRVKDGR